MNSLDTEFHRRLAKRVSEEIQGRTVSLTSGALDHPEYKRICGNIKALTDVLEWAAEIESDMNGGK